MMEPNYQIENVNGMRVSKKDGQVLHETISGISSIFNFVWRKTESLLGTHFWLEEAFSLPSIIDGSFMRAGLALFDRDLWNFR